MRVSRTVLREAEGETPSAYSPMGFFQRCRCERQRGILLQGAPMRVMMTTLHHEIAALLSQRGVFGWAPARPK
jgi:hypothetical protein